MKFHRAFITLIIFYNKTKTHGKTQIPFYFVTVQFSKFCTKQANQRNCKRLFGCCVAFCNCKSARQKYNVSHWCRWHFFSHAASWSCNTAGQFCWLRSSERECRSKRQQPRHSAQQVQRPIAGSCRNSAWYF